jgi:acyl-ACP thioesterase
MITEFYASLQERKPLWSENIRVEVWISELSPIKVFVDFTMKDDKNVVFAKGTSTWLLVDVQTRKPYPCHNLENLVKLHDEHDAIRHTKIRMEKGTTELNTISHNVSPVEIDFNGHTNNQNYVRLVVSLVPSHFIESHNLVDFHIKYAQETFLGDKLIATLQEYGETCLSCDIRKATDQSLVCEISSHWEHR